MSRKILNSKPELIAQSLEKALPLNPRYVVPQHYDILDGEVHCRRLRVLYERKFGAFRRI